MAALESVLIVTVIGGELWSVMSIAELCHPGPKLPLGVHVGVGVISEAFLDESAKDTLCMFSQLESGKR